MTWSVYIEAIGGRRPSEEAIDAFIDAMVEYSGTVAVPQDRAGYGAQFSVDAPNPAAATALALDLFRSAAADAGLSDAPIVRVEAMTEAELDRELGRPAFPELVGVGEIAKLLGVTRQRASEVQTRDGFPAPVARLKSGPVWTRASISRFVEDWVRKPGRPKRAATTGLYGDRRTGKTAAFAKGDAVPGTRSSRLGVASQTQRKAAEPAAPRAKAFRAVAKSPAKRRKTAAK